MIIKSPSVKEECALCNRTVPENALVLRKIETTKVICIPCLVEIAELTIQTPVKFTDKEVTPNPDVVKATRQDNG